MTFGLHQAVYDAFVKFSSPLEGVEHAPYLDDLGLATGAIGCLCNTPALWRAMPWVMPDGSPAQAAEVDRQMESLQAQQGLKSYPANSPRVLAATTIRLTDAGILQVVDQRLEQDVPWLLKCFSKFGAWPADAQLFACSVAWAVGAGWPAKFTNCARLLNSEPPQFLLAIQHAPDANHPGQFLPAAADIATKGNPGIVPRNAQNELALSNAQVVLDQGLPADILYWPSTPLADNGVPAGAA